jgi:hypothetical protein
LLLGHLEFLEGDDPVIEAGVQCDEFAEHPAWPHDVFGGSVSCWASLRRFLPPGRLDGGSVVTGFSRCCPLELA